MFPAERPECRADATPLFGCVFVLSWCCFAATERKPRSNCRQPSGVARTAVKEGCLGKRGCRHLQPCEHCRVEAWALQESGKFDQIRGSCGRDTWIHRPRRTEHPMPLGGCSCRSVWTCSDEPRQTTAARRDWTGPVARGRVCLPRPHGWPSQTSMALPTPPRTTLARRALLFQKTIQAHRHSTTTQAPYRWHAAFSERSSVLDCMRECVGQLGSGPPPNLATAPAPCAHAICITPTFDARDLRSTGALFSQALGAPSVHIGTVVNQVVDPRREQFRAHGVAILRIAAPSHTKLLPFHWDPETCPVSSRDAPVSLGRWQPLARMRHDRDAGAKSSARGSLTIRRPPMFPSIASTEMGGQPANLPEELRQVETL